MLPALVNSLHGMAIRFGNKPEVYLVLRGMKKHIINPDVFFSLFRSWDDVFVLDPKLEDQVPNGEAITDLKVYSLGLTDNRSTDAGFLIINDRSGYYMDWNLLAHYNEKNFMTGHTNTSHMSNICCLPCRLMRTWNANLNAG